MHHARLQRLLSLVLAASAATAAETVFLRNGFHLEAERSEATPHGLRVILANGGWIEIPGQDVVVVQSSSRARSKEVTSPVLAGDPKPPESQEDEIDRFADLAGLPRELVKAVAWAESGNRQDAVSPKGAIGVMQLMPATAADLGVNPEDSAENLEGGTRYLKQLLERYEGDRGQLLKALAAYNAGPGSVERHGGVPPYRETRAYIAKVVRRYLESTAHEGSGR